MTWAKFQSFWNKRGFGVWRKRTGIEVRPLNRYSVVFRFSEAEFIALNREKLEEIYTLWALDNYF
jgi:hypothetical protein